MSRSDGGGGGGVVVGVVATAFFFHAPGLWVFYRRRLGADTARHNAMAAALTLAAVSAGYAWGGGGRAAAVIWAIGHVAWGAWLAARVQRGVAGE